MPDDNTTIYENSEPSDPLRWLKKLIPNKSDTSLREAIEELIEEEHETGNGDKPSVARHERMLITNVLGLRDLTVVDVMIPRADIIAMEVNSTPDDLYKILAEHPHSRLPVYRDNLDDVIGAVNIKDVFTCLSQNQADFQLEELTRAVTFVSPAMKVLDLLLQMRQSRVHLAMVIDEFGGVDGLITINDLIEAVVGEIEDEHDLETMPSLVERKDGTILADARVSLEDFEKEFGKTFTNGDESGEMEDVDTLGGVVYTLVGRIPSRGEIIQHKSGAEFEVLEADPRKIMKLRIRGLKAQRDAAE